MAHRGRRALDRLRHEDARAARELQGMSAAMGGGAVAVLSAGDSPLAGALRSRGVLVVAVDTALTASEQHIRLAAGAPYGLVVDDVGPGPGRVRRLRDAFFHVRPGGAYVVRGVRPGVLGHDVAGRGGLGGFLAELRRAAEPLPPAVEPTREQRDLAALAAAVRSAEVKGHFLVLVSQARGALAKLGEGQVDCYLRLRDDPGLRILQSLPAAPFRSRCDLHDSGGRRRPQYFARFDPPAPTLREYHDALCAPGQVVARDTVLLPDSYRHGQRSRLRNAYTSELGPLFATVPGAGGDAPVLRGAYFHLDNEERGHFGHAMTEQLSRLWAWPAAQAAAPGLKVLMSVTRHRTDLRAWERTLLSAAGIDPEDVVIIDRPVRVERLLSATPQFSMPEYVDPRIAETWRRVGDALATEPPEREYPRRIFCGRSTRKRACRNAAEVRALFVRHGFEVVRPERLSLGQQVHMFRAAEVVAGWAGSALFSALYAEQPRHLISVTSRSYTATNEYLIASVLGHRLDAVVSEPEEPTFASPYTVDFAREGRFLRGVLEGL